MAKNLKYIALWLLVTLLASACSSDGGDGNEVTNRNEAKKEIGIKPDVWKMAEATRATTYDNTALQSDGFTVYAYKAGESTAGYAYIDNKTVSYNAPNWIITGRPYYWPAYNLDFFAYAPATLPSYITAGPAYTSAHNVTFTCSSLPVTNAGQGSSLKEFMFGMALGKNGENAGSGVPLQFQHPFARIKLQLAASHPNVTINSITFRSIKNNGNYNHSATPKWSTTDVATNFVLSLTGEAAVFDNNSTAKQIGDDYIMIPQDWDGVIVVNADCLYWGEKKNYPSLTTTVPTDWQPGYSYTYTFSISPDDLKVGTTSQFTEQW